MPKPEIKYARSGDLGIAYEVTGEANPIGLVWAPSWASHLVLDWEWPPLVEWRQGLARFCRLIVFDKRGTGLSDRQAGVATLEQRSDDIRAVMDAAESEQAVLFGVSEGGSMACFFAATYPERTRALILWEVQARWVQTADYPWGATPEHAEKVIRKLADEGPTEEYLFGSTPEARARFDPAYYEFFKRYAHASDGIRELGLEIRAGLHTGECELLEGKVSGIAVHIGARVAARATPGEVLVSQTVRDLVAGSGIEFADRGLAELKGVPDRWRLWAIRR